MNAQAASGLEARVPVNAVTSGPKFAPTAGSLPLSKRIADYIELTKPRVVAMVLVTTSAGYYLGEVGGFNWPLFLALLIGTALAAGGTLSLNQYAEIDLDAQMMRTRMRPLPAGRMKPMHALMYGAGLTIAGLLLLWLLVNPLSSLVTAAITVVYLFGYTPMKRISSLCSVVGAIPGALPPVAGWAAVRGSISLEPMILFAIMFLWQLPHSLAIAQLYCNDYARAGIRLLPTDDPHGNSTGRQVVSNSLALLGVGLLPTILGFAGNLYFVAALTLGVVQLISGVRMAMDSASRTAARRVILASLLYLPLLLLVMAIDKV